MSTARFRRGHRIVVVGSGAAGIAAAGELRRRGFEGTLTVLGAEPDAPYDRPACSKGLLNGHRKPSDVLLPVPHELNLDVRRGVTAVRLDPLMRRVDLDNGQECGYDGLIIANGARPVAPSGWPFGEPGLHLLHTITDAWRLRRQLRTARRVAIIGGGLTGCEVACTMRGLAREAIIIDSNPCLMNRAVGEPIGALITGSHQRAGIQTRLGRRVRTVEPRRNRWRIELDDGEYVQADAVVATIGDRPDTAWLAGSGLDIENGVACDAHLRAIGVDDVVAAGAIARWPNPRYGYGMSRVGQWIAALEQGRAAARTLLAGDRPTPPVALLPRFWSHQDDLRIQAAGQVDPRAEVALTLLRPGRTDTARAGVLASYYLDGRLSGLVAVNAPHAFTATTRALLHDVPPDVVPAESTGARRGYITV